MSSLHFSHSDRLSMPSYSWSSIESHSLSATYNTVSSAYFKMLQYSTIYTASLKMIRNNRGLSIHTFGTPVNASCSLARQPLKATNAFRENRYSVNHSNSPSFIRKIPSFISTMPWLTSNLDGKIANHGCAS